MGIDAFCMKPLTAQELAQTIQHVLQNRVEHKDINLDPISKPDAQVAS